MRRRNFFVRTLIFRYFGGCAGRGYRPVCAKRVAGAGGRARMRIDGGDRRGQKKVARCGEGGLTDGRRVDGASGHFLLRFGCSGCSVRCFLSHVRLSGACKRLRGGGGALRVRRRAIWKSCPHALSLRPEPFVEPCIAERDISTTVGGASSRVPSGFMSTGSAASSD